MRIKYVLTEAMVGLWRNVTMTVAMIITMAVSLTLLGASVLMYLQVNSMKDLYYEQIEVSIFMKQDATDAQKAAVKSDLDKDPLVASYHFEDQQQAYEHFTQIYKEGAPNLVDSVPANALPESFRVKLKDPSQSQAIYDKYNGLDGVDSVIDQKKLLEKVFGVLGSLQKLALVVSLVQGIAALLLVINTIQVAAYSKRREVAVMKLVGASNWFIQAPFVMEAVAASLIGAIVAWLVLIAAKIFVFDGALKPLMTLLTPVPWSNIHLIVLPLLVAAGAAISSITAWIALRFHLRV